MKAALVNENGVVVNVFEVSDINFILFKKRGLDVRDAEKIGIEIDDYTEDGVIFYRDVPIYDFDTGEQIGVEKVQLNEATEEDEMREALTILGIEVN